jgi:cytosine/adenosine deaminase-related metal-dependent hydrolase
MSERLCLSRGGGLRRRSACAAGRGRLLRRAVAQRHNHGGRLLRGLFAIGGALFAEAQARNMRLIAGKCMMDRNVPEALRDTAQSGYDQSKALIAKWLEVGRLGYAITPRWAGSSSPAQLEAAGTLWREHPDLHLQTHIAENRDEVKFIASRYPERKDFLDVYDHYGLVGRRAVLGHGIWLSDSELSRCHEREASIAHCPPRTSSSAAASSPRAAPRTLSVRSMARMSAPARASRCSPRLTGLQDIAAL